MRRFCTSVALAASVFQGASAAAQQPVAAGAPLTPFQRAKTEALLETKLPCLGCHALQGEGGRIGPDLSDVGARLDAARIRRQIEQPVGIMPKVPLTAGTLDLLVGYLSEQRTAPSTTRPPVNSQTPAGASEGERLYNVHCVACHGGTGNGDGWNAEHLDRPPARHADARVMSTRTDDRLFDGIFAGAGILGGSARMPPYGQTLSRQDIRALVAYIRTLCRCRQPSWADDPR